MKIWKISLEEMRGQDKFKVIVIEGFSDQKKGNSIQLKTINFYTKITIKAINESRNPSNFKNYQINNY